MLAKTVRKVLLGLVHFILTLCEKLTEFSEHIKAWRNPKKPVLKELEYITQFVNRLKRRPIHLVVQVETDQLDVQELALIVVWSLWAGIPYISFYDADGSFKQMNDPLFQEVEKLKQNTPGSINWSQRLVVSDINYCTNRSNSVSSGHKEYSTGHNNYSCRNNGYSNGSKPHISIINVINRHNSTKGLVHLIKDLVTKKVSCIHEEEFYTAGEIDNLLKEYNYYPNIPEPDVMIYCGPVCMTKGLLPWHIRLTEFIPIRKHKSLHVDDYLSVLSRFSKCTVKLGK